jgi:hypothetical protein
MSYWDIHFLAGSLLALLIGIIFYSGFLISNWVGGYQISFLGRYQWRVETLTLYCFGYLLVLSLAEVLLHFWLDTYNPILIIGG